MNVILYSTGCPQCKILKAKLDQAGIQYTVVTDQAVMTAMGFKSAPMLQIDNNTYKFVDAVQWIRGYVNGN